MKKSKSIFKKFSLNRNIIKWEDYLYKFTPIEKIGNLYFKREDYFAPLGYGGINGSKLRQAIWLINKYVKEGGVGSVISGASTKSPQLSMASGVAYHYGLKSRHVVGSTKPNIAKNKENVKIATWFGADFIFLRLGFHSSLVKRLSSLIENENKGGFYLKEGITIDEEENDKNIVNFHELGANQVLNIPDFIENIILPAGSCNSAISILFGLSLKKPKNLKNIYLIGIGPDKMKFINNRLHRIMNFTGINTVNFIKNFENIDLKVKIDKNPINLYYDNLYLKGIINYQQEVKFCYYDLDFHPTYEGKMMKYLSEDKKYLFNDKTLFWIVGSKPFLKNMLFLENEVGVYHNNIVVKENYEDEKKKKIKK